jgi:hypothetical protein
MKTSLIKIRLAGALAILFLLPACTQEPDDPPSEYSPVLMKRSELENSVEWRDPRDIKKAHKIYLKDNFIFIVERFEGIHVIDNANPETPQKLGFIRIPGNQDVAVKGQYLYADNAVDLLTIDIQSWPPEVVDRDRDALPSVAPPDNLVLADHLDSNNWPDSTVVIKWSKS